MIYSRDDEAIVAQCTPRGSSALALIRIAGVNAFTVAQALLKFPSKQALATVQSHTIHYARLVSEDGSIIDHVMVIVMRGPKTFTGQDTIEITCHGNQLIVEAIIARAINAGARLAGPGEFSQRAFLNNKLDLLQAEAINELIHAQTEAALQKSLAQLEGTFSHWVNDLEQGLVKALAWSEASFEFLDEETEFGQSIKKHLEHLCATIDQLKTMYHQQQQIRQGIRIVLIGAVNAGKSSLFNTLLHSKRAIVSDIPGTTRDTIEAGLVVDGNQWTLIDTAGIRATSDQVEQEGITRSRDEAHKADIIVLVIDPEQAINETAQMFFQELSGLYASKMIIAYTKTDKVLAEVSPQIELCAQSAGFLKTSTITGEGIAELRDLLGQKAAALLSAHQSPFLLNIRHYNILLGLEQQLIPLIAMLSEPSIHYELVSFHLKQALESLTQLTGKSISEAAINEVFKQFCVGK